MRGLLRSTGRILLNGAQYRLFGSVSFKAVARYPLGSIKSMNQIPTYLPSGDKDYQVDVPQDLPGRENKSLFPMRYPIYDVIC